MSAHVPNQAKWELCSFAVLAIKAGLQHKLIALCWSDIAYFKFIMVKL